MLRLYLKFVDHPSNIFFQPNRRGDLFFTIYQASKQISRNSQIKVISFLRIPFTLPNHFVHCLQIRYETKQCDANGYVILLQKISSYSRTNVSLLNCYIPRNIFYKRNANSGCINLSSLKRSISVPHFILQYF